ncbi:tyrosine-type recombinase/integrase [Undibacterium arcticum]
MGAAIRRPRRSQKNDVDTDPDVKEAPRPIRESSVKVYLSMFGKYLRWLEHRQLHLLDVKASDIDAFMEERMSGKRGKARDLSSRSIRKSYLRLLERMYEHLKLVPNPAKDAMFHASKQDGGLGRDAHLVSLSPEQIAAFMAALPEINDFPKNWKRRRDRAMLCLMLGAGLRVSEVIGMYIENIGLPNDNGSIRVTVSAASNDGTSRWHQTQLRAFAAPDVLAWVEERKRMDMPDQMLFPANEKGVRLDKATLYRQAKKTFARAGIDVARHGGRTLRNAFAVNELEGGTPPEEVTEFLGLHKQKSINIYLTRK